MTGTASIGPAGLADRFDGVAEVEESSREAGLLRIFIVPVPYLSTFPRP